MFFRVRLEIERVVFSQPSDHHGDHGAPFAHITLFFSAIFMPAMAASAEAMICGRVKQVVVLVLIPLEVRILSTSMPCMLAGTLIITLWTDGPQLIGILEPLAPSR